MTDCRAELTAYARRMARDGLTVGTSGNLSCRRSAGGALAITPTGIASDVLAPQDIAWVDEEGRLQDGLLPSSEWPLHRAIYRVRPDIAAIVHIHSLWATALASAGQPLPPIHYQAARLGGTVPVVPYAPYGSIELADGAAHALAVGVEACLLANHGAVTVGRTLADAYDKAVLLEWLAALYGAARAFGGARSLTMEEVTRAAQQLASYGQPDGRET